MKAKQRISNMELLRIIAMMMIISLHQNGTVDALASLKPGGTNYYLSHIAESFSICAVNCYVLISGYFMIGKREAPVKKCLHLLVDVAFWGLLGYGCAFLLWGETAGIKEIVVAILPYIKGQRWFVRDYIILVLLAPFLNVCLNRLSKYQYRILVALLLLIFSVWPSFFPNPPIDDYGFSCVHFIHLYVLAGYLKLHMCQVPKKIVCVACYLGSVILIYGSALQGVGYAYAYNYLFVMTASVSMFLFFRGLTIQSTVINVLAAGVFDVFMIHTTGFFADLVYIKIFHADTALQGDGIPYLVGLISCPLVFYLFSIVLATVKRGLFRVSMDKWLERLHIENYSVDRFGEGECIEYH